VIYEPKAQTLRQPLVVFLPPAEPELIMTTLAGAAGVAL